MINASQYTRLKHNSEKINCLSFSLILIHSEQSLEKRLKYSRNNLEWESKDWPIITKTHPAFFLSHKWTEIQFKYQLISG